MTETQRRFYVVSPGGSTVAGYGNHQGAEAAALAFGDGAHVVDTLGLPYQPAVMIVDGGELVYVGYGSFDRRLGLDANLIEAVKRGYLPIIRAFLAKGADINAPDKNGGLALHWAVAKGKNEIVRLLIEAGATVNRADINGMTPLQLAESKNRREIAAMLHAAGAAA
jgi:hypothetical protein|tara:strand:+ start:475 stop:975 length:501 start_codon:yes stop_codon:yes gene_type:complete